MRRIATSASLGLALLCAVSIEAGAGNASGADTGSRTETAYDIANLKTFGPQPNVSGDMVKAVAGIAVPDQEPSVSQICSLIEEHADRVGMDRNFFARLIWKESRFRTDAISPVGAQGIAQFMPATAQYRGLDDPNDHREAISHSADYLSDLKKRFGNWGLAAAAYNGGPTRLGSWIEARGKRRLGRETLNYVKAVTHRPVTWFVAKSREVERKPLIGGRSFAESCAELPKTRDALIFASLDGAEAAFPMPVPVPKDAPVRLVVNETGDAATPPAEPDRENAPQSDGEVRPQLNDGEQAKGASARSNETAREEPSQPSPNAPDPTTNGEDVAVAITPDMAPDPAESPAAAVEPKQRARSKNPTTREICSIIADNADRVLMNRDFFARLIWKESRFDIGAVSPVGARGIAQFMPYTAKERGLADPYDYVEAIKHSSLYLRDLKNELGNWGLAAAAYNGGINRMKRWIAGGAKGALPYETVDYVNSITYRPIEWFLESGRDVERRPLDEELDFLDSCSNLPIMKTRAVFASTEAPAVRSQPWGIQVAGHVNRSVAMKMFGRVRSQFGSVVGSKQPMVVRTRAGGGARIYAVRIGADSRNEATQVCGRMRQSGGSCMVVKN